MVLNSAMLDVYIYKTPLQGFLGLSLEHNRNAHTSPLVGTAIARQDSRMDLSSLPMMFLVTPCPGPDILYCFFRKPVAQLIL